MNVWIVDPRNYTPYYDYSLCKALRDAGCNVRWITRPYIYDKIENRDNLIIDNDFGSSIPSPTWLSWGPFDRFMAPWAYLLSVIKFIRKIRRDSPDIVHIQWAAMPLVDLILFRTLKSLPAHLVYTVHNVLPHEVYRWHFAIYKHLYASADQLIVHSAWAASELSSQFGISRDKMTVIPQGNLFDFAEFIPKHQAQNQLDLSSRRVILFFGILRPYKGLRYLLQALPLVRESVPNIHLLLVGHIHRNDQLDRYRSLIRDLGVEGAVSLHTAFVPYNQLGIYFGAADVVALPYLETTDSAVIPTAYTFGRPVITTNVGGLPETVESGESGLLIPPCDVGALTRALVELLTDSDRCSRMGQSALRLAQTRHEWHSIAITTLKVYHSLL